MVGERGFLDCGGEIRVLIEAQLRVVEFATAGVFLVKNAYDREISCRQKKSTISGNGAPA